MNRKNNTDINGEERVGRDADVGFSYFSERDQEQDSVFMEDKEGRPSYMSDQQLEAIVEELDKMDRIRDEKVFYPYYPKGIADSWDYKDPLAKKIAGYLGYICQVIIICCLKTEVLSFKTNRSLWS